MRMERVEQIAEGSGVHEWREHCSTKCTPATAAEVFGVPKRSRRKRAGVRGRGASGDGASQQ
eukprot:9450581-Pyramimonas_sp.AAC.1